MQLNDLEKYVFIDLTKRKSKKILKKESITSLEQLSDSWFSDHHNWRKKFAGLLNTEQLELKIRWYSQLGQKCKSAIMDQIFDRSSPIINGRRLVELSKVKFSHKAVEHTLVSFPQQFQTSQIGGTYDLRGLAFNNLGIMNLRFERVSFHYSVFCNCKINMIEFSNCGFAYCDFNGSFFSGNSLDNSNFSSCNLASCLINGQDLSKFTQPIVNRISWKGAIKETYQAITGMKRNSINPFSNRKHTVFSATTELPKSEYGDINVRSYIEWYQRFERSLSTLEKASLLKKLTFFFNIWTSKLFSSVGTLLLNTLIYIVAFGGIYYFIRDEIEYLATNTKLTFIDCIYFSTITFSSLGFGDIAPVSILAKLLTSFEVLSGYFLLSMIVYILGIRISNWK